ncbi:MAG: hypothetical protein KGL39_37945 [Patescibacteria group bacterium]|nr:hypothetical protein [Patescibacteria group bacterium]
MKTQQYTWQYLDRVWWLVARYYLDSGFTSPYQFKLALDLANPAVFTIKGAWAAVTPGTVVSIPSR